jgi:hypothetical protein
MNTGVLTGWVMALSFLKKPRRVIRQTGQGTY